MTNQSDVVPVNGSTSTVEENFETLAERVDQAVSAVRNLPPEARKEALAMKSAIEDFHKMGLTHIVRTLKADSRGKELLFALVDEPSVYALFAMHGIVRADMNTRVLRVLDMVRPYMQSHGGDVSLDRVEGDTVYVQLQGACNGCSMSAVTLREGVEEALLTQIPEIRRVEVTPTEPGPALIPLDALMADIDMRGWIQGPTVDEVPSGRVYRLDVAGVAAGDAQSAGADFSIIIVNVENQLNAYHNACAHMGLPLDGGMLDMAAGTLTCPWHGFCFDATSGECLTAPSAQLEPFPLRVEDGRIWIRPKS